MTDNTSIEQTFEADRGQPVLVAIDFSEDSKAALSWACQYAEGARARLILLHVVHDPVSSPGFYRKGKADPSQTMQAVAESMMVEFLEQAKTDNPSLASLDKVETRFVPGLPPTRIVEVADLLNARLIIIGSRGITGLPHMLLGSVAERVVELATIPVVVVKSEKHTRPGKKEKKIREKKLKKEKKRLEGMLGLNRKPVAEGGPDG